MLLINCAVMALYDTRNFAEAAKSDDQTARTVFTPTPVLKFDDAVTAPPDRAKTTVQGSTLSFSLKGADGSCESNSEIRLKAIEAQPRFAVRTVVGGAPRPAAGPVV